MPDKHAEEFYEIIDFAVDKEKEAVKFYADLADLVQFKARKEMLEELADMERGHVAALENIRTGKIKMREAPQVQTMNISDYLVAVKPSSRLSYQDILITAMKREEASNRLYTDLAQLSAGEIKDVFERLAAEEAQHKLQFEELYNTEILQDN